VKRTFAATLILLLLFGAAAQASVDVNAPIDIMVNNSYIKADVNPFLISGTTYVPIRFIGEALGAEVSWDDFAATAAISADETIITLPIGKNNAFINDKAVSIEHGILLVNDRTFAPARFICEALGAAVSWDGTHLTVIVEKEGLNVPSQLTYSRGYSDKDIYWLGRIINSEAGGEPMQGKIGVGNVVLNRVKSNLYPNSIYDVIFDSGYGIQFEPVLNGMIYDTPSFDSLIAAKYCLQGENAVGESLFFLNPKIASSLWITDNRLYYTVIGNHFFYL